MQVGPGVRIPFAPAASQERTGPPRCGDRFCLPSTLPSCAPLAELDARERPVERAVELLRLKRFAKELKPTLCGEAYLVVAPRDHDDWKSKVFRMTSKRRAVLSPHYGI